jgi:hypothetical protein
LQVAEIFEGRGEIAHLRSEVGGSLVLIQQVQPEQNHGGGDTDRGGQRWPRSRFWQSAAAKPIPPTMLLIAAIRLAW